jgi:hypothetical protein
MRPLLQRQRSAITLLSILLLSATATSAQTTSFTYQGRLTDGSNPANGSYDLQFRLFDALSGGNQIGATLVLNGTAVTAGIFNATLDFGANAFPGANRWLEIGVRPGNSGSAFTLLTPLQPITSMPYAIQTLNASSAINFSGSLGGDVTGTQAATVLANNAVTTAKLSDGSVTDAKIASVSASKITGTIPGGSTNYIQNSTAQQTSANFNISGNGTAGGTVTGNVVNAATQFNLGGSRILSNPGTDNVFAGVEAGSVNTGSGNTFMGAGAGRANTLANLNSFFGDRAGWRVTTGGGNSYFGAAAGSLSDTDYNNSYFGALAGANSTGYSNSFFGFEAGQSNTHNGNSYFGAFAGSSSTGATNSFFGAVTGGHDVSGFGLTLIGNSADVASDSLSNATAIGAGATVAASNTLVLGNNVNVGIGTSAPTSKLEIVAQDGLAITGYQPYITLRDTSTGNTKSVIQGFNGNINFIPQSFIGGSAGMVLYSSTGHLFVVGNVCAANISCASDENLKKDIQPLKYGLDQLLRLRPVSWQWKDPAAKQIPLGLLAQEVERVIPELVLRDPEPEKPLGLNYLGLVPITINAIQEQQETIERQQEQIADLGRQMERQHQEFEELKQSVCLSYPNATACHSTRTTR